jgi:hypothetical protein
MKVLRMDSKMARHLDLELGINRILCAIKVKRAPNVVICCTMSSEPLSVPSAVPSESSDPSSLPSSMPSKSSEPSSILSSVSYHSQASLPRWHLLCHQSQLSHHLFYRLFHPSPASRSVRVQQAVELAFIDFIGVKLPFESSEP